jgi:hypothetical protein
MFIASLFIIAKLRKQPRCPTTDEWIKKMWYLHTVEFYSARKKNEILSFASKWLELENIILGKVSQAQKAKNDLSIKVYVTILDYLKFLRSPSCLKCSCFFFWMLVKPQCLQKLPTKLHALTYPPSLLAN